MTRRLATREIAPYVPVPRTRQTLYRLYLLRQRERRRVVIIDGGAKPNSTALPDSFYDDLAPFAVADDFARAALTAEEEG